MWTIGVYTSGGDAPGMNAAIRAVVRMAHSKNARVIGIRSGYSGMIASDFCPLDLRSVAGVIQRGGTFLQTGRCPEFLQRENRKIAFENLVKAGINALVCIGGDGSFRGAHALNEEFGIPVIGIPGTIDNDIFGTDFTIGFDTAVNTALEAIDRIRDTATSHNRIFIVEVMGRDSGYLALDVGIAGGAQEIFIPEEINDINASIQRLKDSIDAGKQYSIFVAAEGQKPGRAYDLCDAIKKKTGLDAKVCILGHIQRGGSPTARDRVIASALGAGAVDAILRGESDKMAGIQNGKLVLVPLHEAISKKPPVRKDKILLARILSN
jgi:6-phosphofructokinase 1